MTPNHIPSFVVSDLDNTLAVSKQPIDQEMAILFTELLRRTRIAIVSGGTLEQLEKQIANQLPEDAPLENLYFLPTSGAALYTHEGTWKKKYEETLSEDEITRIEDAIEEAVKSTGILNASTPTYGERVEARGAEVTFSALGQEAPVAEKEAWDPDMNKRHMLQAALIHLLPGFDIKLGGSTSIDITKRGVNKAFGIRKLSEQTDTAIADMIYIGDQLSNGGNDEAVKETGIATHPVQGPSETKEFIRSLLAL